MVYNLEFLLHVFVEHAFISEKHYKLHVVLMDYNDILDIQICYDIDFHIISIYKVSIGQ